MRDVSNRFTFFSGHKAGMGRILPSCVAKFYSMRRFVSISILAVLLLAGPVALAQPTKTLPDNPTEFMDAFVVQVKKFGNKEVHEYMEAFQTKWLGGSYTNSEQERFITQTNIMLIKNYKLEPDILEYTRTFESIKSEESFGKIDVNEFFAASDSCILLLNRKRTMSYFAFVKQFVQTGAAFKTSNASWTYSQPNPSLQFGTYTNEETGQPTSFPYFVFDNTNLTYRNPKDSTIIYNTKGELNMVNRMFKAEGGRLDWAKMNIDAGEVYCELLDYGLNLNYSFVKIDTVIFHYNGLIDKPLRGKYEDINKGYGDINKANYPYFRSYDGGVVIENFIPNVRYEGGFSLRGIRKIGSAFFKEVDVEPEPEPEPEEVIDEVEDTFEDDFGYEYDESAYYLDEDDANEYTEDEWGDDDFESESEDDLSGGDFDGFDDLDLSFLDKELKLFKAQLTIFRLGEKAMNLRANEFVLDLKALNSRRTEVALYLGKEDSITHPSVDVIYNVDSSEVFLIKDVKDKFARQPFMSPYHNYYLYFDAIRWNTMTDVIEFTSIIDKENETSAIESKDFFKKQRWNQFKGVLKFNPIGAIYRYATLHPGETITVQTIIDEYKLPDQYDAMKFAMVDVEGSGFVEYDAVTEEITPLPKLYDWAMAARGRKDYDAIQVISQVEAGNNAELDLQTLGLAMEGVSFFSLSDSQFVRVLPNQRHVEVKKNRDMQFDGIVAAGKLNFYGRVSKDTVDMQGIPGKFRFQYDNYKILVDSLDSLRFILVREKSLNTVFSPLQKALRNTTIEGVTGAIYINKPNNKNGLEQLAEYPVFDSYTNSYVYWYNPNVRDGVYSKEKFFFSIDPFVLDSLESFDEAALSFEGEFYSSEIFPRIRQRLAVMEDFTLGLKEITPPDTGYATYDGKGRFNGEITLDGSGLSSAGQMDFLHTVAKSDSFQMYFDSVNAVTEEFFMPGGEKDGAYYPEIKAKSVNYKWLTKKDEIELETMTSGEPIVLFEGEGIFEGKLVITKEGLKGSGKLTMGNVTVESDEILFKEKEFEAKTGTFAVMDKSDPTKQLYKAENVEVKYDVSGHHSTFQANEIGVANSSFPQQSYRTSLSKGTYDKKSNDILLERVSPKQNQNYFYSTDKLQDSLAYYANSAHYDFDQKEIEIEGVPYIYVADAKITPDTGKVTVKPDGFLQKLEDAVIEANLETKYHRLYDGNVEITSSKRYNGSGKYDYIPIAGNEQYINMTEIKVQGDTLSVAKGNITEDEGFYLTDRIFFKGQTFLEADRKYMRFSGEVKIDSDNKVFDTWFKFDDIVNPDSVFVKIEKSLMGDLVVGLHYIPRNRIFYSTFLQKKKDNTHKDVALVEGGLTVDRSNNTTQFRIGPKPKLTGLEYRGTTSSLNDSLNIITTEGKIDVPFNWGRNTIDLTLAGSWKDDIGNREVSTQLVGAFKFDCISKDAWSKLADKAKLITAINDDIDWNSYEFREGMAELLDPNYRQPDKLMKEFVTQIQNSVIYSDIKVAKNLPYSLVLSDIRFRFDEDFKSFYHSGAVGLIGINGETINKMTGTNSKIEYNIGRFTPAGVRLPDTLRVYLELDEVNWIFFEYSSEVLNTASSDIDGYNAVLRGELEKRKKNEGYRFEMTDELKKDDFLQRFVNRYIWRTNRPAPRSNDTGGDDTGGDDTGGDDTGGDDTGGDDTGGDDTGGDDTGGDDTGGDDTGGDNGDITPPGMGDDNPPPPTPPPGDDDNK